jgi:hypothetical protein
VNAVDRLPQTSMESAKTSALYARGGRSCFIRTKLHHGFARAASQQETGRLPTETIHGSVKHHGSGEVQKTFWVPRKRDKGVSVQPDSGSMR